ncbi:MAG: pyridoxal phosphate-dependent aminotransferase [Fibromonadaceae bacterium]|jgi:aspartate/methionine/tyrosine aminotransferase|nr:pyridoxal phosphate-dependent aminotransferase [Fibromonadaceae bacterium]
MRRKLLSDGSKEFKYEIREIVKKANQLKALGLNIHWENIGDPIEKKCQLPSWIKGIISNLAQENKSYGYCPSKGILATREFLCEKNNALGGAQIGPEDILFFNGLGDAIATAYKLLDANSRVIGPSPAYSTHSSAEAAHAHSDPITYRLDPANHWYPDLEELENKIKYNQNIVGILIINPDNPTGMVWPLEHLKKIIDIARRYRLFIISDEVYNKIVYNGVESYSLAEYIEDVPGLAMKGLSKDVPWPGSRCGWMEYYNRDKDSSFAAFCEALDNAKMIEVCSTTLPQLALPLIYGDPRFEAHRLELNERIGKRSAMINNILGEVPELMFNPTYGAFYNSIIFKDGVLNNKQTLHIENPIIRKKVEEWCKGVSPDYRFVYYLLGATGICVVPISSFCSELLGFRITLLEEDEEELQKVFTSLRDSIKVYVRSA